MLHILVNEKLNCNVIKNIKIQLVWKLNLPYYITTISCIRHLIHIFEGLISHFASRSIDFVATFKKIVRVKFENPLILFILYLIMLKFKAIVQAIKKNSEISS